MFSLVDDVLKKWVSVNLLLKIHSVILWLSLVCPERQQQVWGNSSRGFKNTAGVFVDQWHRILNLLRDRAAIGQLYISLLGMPPFAKKTLRQQNITDKLALSVRGGRAQKTAWTHWKHGQKIIAFQKRSRNMRVVTMQLRTGRNHSQMLKHRDLASVL